MTENLPVPAGAKLPATYEAAERAIAALNTVEEAKAWADKAAALAYYARQANDKPLRRLAQRAELRATNRMEELLRQYPELHGGDRKTVSSCQPDNLISRRQAAHQAGLNDRQYRDTQALGAVSAPELKAALESDDPPTPRQLAERARSSCQPDNLKSARTVAPADPAQVAKATALLREFAAFCDTHDPVRIACSPGIDAELLRTFVSTIDRWLDAFVTRLPGEEAA